jgi:methyl-accepting chemotaxis protein
VAELEQRVADVPSRRGLADAAINGRVARTSRMTGTGFAATQVLAAAADLSANGESLKHQLDEFLREVRAA